MANKYSPNYDVDPCQCQVVHPRPGREGKYDSMEMCVASTGCQKQKMFKPVYNTDDYSCTCREAPNGGEYTNLESCLQNTGCSKYNPVVPGPWYVLQGCDARYGHDTCNEMQYKCKGYETLPSDYLEEVGGLAQKSLKRCLNGFGTGHPDTYLDGAQNKGCGICSKADCDNARKNNLLKDFEAPDYDDTWPNWFACRVGGGGYSRTRAIDPNYFKGKDYYGNPLCKKGCCNIKSCL
jgi:hypothetical protein